MTQLAKDTSASMQVNLAQHIQKYITLSDHEIHRLSEFTETIHLKKKAWVLQENSVCHHWYFVEKGCLRMFFINSKGVEQITQFALEGWWITDFNSFLNKVPSAYAIQTIEASTIVSIHQKVLEQMLAELPGLEKYFRLVLQKAVAASQHRAKLSYEMSKEEFFLHFSTSFPDFMQRVPQYMIASYLGLTPEYLSELRKKFS
ncbi:MAG: Crp/Fnr family transcriptional regulator [Marinilabiliales bacterium]|nr:Crp/Fnr family transcriptional regulator [Marinilabiliales bacterium]